VENGYGGYRRANAMIEDLVQGRMAMTVKRTKANNESVEWRTVMAATGGQMR